MECGCGYDRCPECSPTYWEQYAVCRVCSAPCHPGFTICPDHGAPVGRDDYYAAVAADTRPA